MKSAPSGSPDLDAPITRFRECHHGILSVLGRFGELATLLEPAARARAVAKETLVFFRAAIIEHHVDEERELFPAVLASASKGEEHDRVHTLVLQLTAQHREIEADWKALEPEVRKVAKGQDGIIDPAAIDRLVSKYGAHARFEEEAFLPLSEAILGRNGRDMGALGLSLHMRHRPRAPGHI